MFTESEPSSTISMKSTNTVMRTPHNHSGQNTEPTNKELMVQFANESDLMLNVVDTPRMLNMDNARVVNKGPHKAM
jgi:hypothetical protein